MQGQCKEKDSNPKEEPNRRDRAQNTVTGMRNAFDGLVSGLDVS